MKVHDARKLIAVIVGVACGGGAAIAAAPAGVPAGYRLVWADEFDKKGAPDPLNWGYETWANKDLWWHNDREYYTDHRLENAAVDGDGLKITARLESMTGSPGWVGQEYTSARLSTKNLRSWKYGFFDIRAKLPCGRGVWPALWLLSDQGTWPVDGEIDLMEAVGYEVPSKIYGTLHNGTEGKEPNASGGKVIPDACTAFHNYQLDWRPDSMTFLVDGAPYYRKEKARSDYAHWPYDHPFFMILDVAVGGVWGGVRGIDPAVFPQALDLRYIRVYQR